jgi:predicted Ser/Thr protein kinase
MNDHDRDPATAQVPPLLADRYRIVSPLGSGGMADVYLAEDERLGRQVAVKVLKARLAADDEFVERFRIEAQAAASLNHPGIVAVYDRGTAEGTTYIAMEYVRGETLKQRLRREGALPPDEAVPIALAVLSALSAAHARAIVHRDVTSYNVMLDQGGRVVVTDFGIARMGDSALTRTGAMMGTSSYLSPEQAQGRQADERSDLYSLGVVLYEMLTGRVPFDGESVGEVLMKHLTAQPDVTVLPEPYRSIVAKAMEKDPEQRYRSANEFLAALPPLQTALPGAARLPSGSSGPKNQTVNGQEKKDSPRPLGEGPGVRAAQGETVVTAKIVKEEPVLRELGRAWQTLVNGWNQWNLNPTLKVLLLVGISFVLIFNAHIVIPLGIMLLMFYGSYRFIRWIVLSISPSMNAGSAGNIAPPELAKTVAAPSPEATAARVASFSIRNRDRWQRHHERSLPALVLRTPRERVTDLIGSLLLSTLVAAAMTVVMTLILGGYLESETRPEQLAWLFAMSVAGSWTVLIPSKFWEGTKGESTPRRFLMMVLGMGLGVLAFGTMSLFFVNLTHGIFFTREWSTFGRYHLPVNFYSFDGHPLLPAFVAVFGTLFLLIRWWRQADPLRCTRLSVWSVIVSVVMAGVIAAFWHFPQPWLPMLAGTISIAVQLSSPWVHPRERSAKRR